MHGMATTSRQTTVNGIRVSANLIKSRRGVCGQCPTGSSQAGSHRGGDVGIYRLTSHCAGRRGPINVGGWLVTDATLGDQCCGLRSEDVWTKSSTGVSVWEIRLTELLFTLIGPLWHKSAPSKAAYNLRGTNKF